MSILIKGMKMPKNCDECRIMTYEDTNCISVRELYCGCPIVFKAHPQHEEHRPDYCPLIELPSHGDLIDRDALMSGVDDGDDFMFIWAITDAPTIIEAENE